MNKIKLIINLIINLIFYTIANIIPKNQNLWIFGAWYGQKYSDNPKAFFEYIQANHSDKTKVIWIAKNKETIHQIRQNGHIALHEKSLSGIWNQMRAGKAIVCQSLHDDLFSPAIGNSTPVIQLWHGIPLKKIMFDAFVEKEKNSLGKFVDWLSPYNKHRNDIITATSPFTQSLLAKAFRVEPRQVLTSGFPRNDVFFQNIEPQTTDQFKCIYMPTFRGGKATECDLFEQYGFDVNTIEEQLIKHNIHLTLRMHPVNKPPAKIIEQIKNSSVIKLDASDDIYETINKYDCLITDYSSVYIDFLLSNKPIIFAPFDLEEYKKQERSLYFEFEEATINPYQYNWAGIVDRLISLKNNNTTEEYDKNYNELKNRFHSPPSNEKQPFCNGLYNQLNKIER